VLGWLLRRKCKRELWRDIGSVIVHMACWSAFWGVAFGEFFGDLGHRLIHMEPLWVERSQAVLPVISFSVGLGVVHVLLGLFVGFLHGLRHKDNHMWMERLANILLITALIIALVHVKGWLPKSFFTLSVSITIVGLLLLLKVGFLGGLVETIGAVGNILSYVRIAAIGLSSAILAVVASRFVDALGVSFIGIFLALSIHLLNLILAVAGSGLHAARLHYVEFLGKFYKGGGKEYKPFARKRGSLVWKRR
ncbi:MAG TPA: V-type ATPase 116kDa subunit family protein, partial [Thermosynergistes sp.]|nr:V-type ATPase 116kDa subunit family protein [Thermosynergistes sp.]